MPHEDNIKNKLNTKGREDRSLNQDLNNDKTILLILVIKFYLLLYRFLITNIISFNNSGSVRMWVLKDTENILAKTNKKFRNFGFMINPLYCSNLNLIF